MLFTDSDIITPTDLAVVDQEVLSDEKAFNLTLSGPNSIIRRAVEEAGTEITAAFQNFSGYLVGLGISANHVAAVLNTLTTAINRPRARLNQVCALDPDATHLHMKRWLEYRALTGLYRSLYHRKVEDRFEKKMNNYKAEASVAWNNLISNGLPVVLQPFACPGAIREYGAGVWGPTNVTGGGTGSDETGHVYDVVITWVNSVGYVSWANNGNSESAPSSIVTLPVTGGQVLTISLAGLNPPTGLLSMNLGTADGIYTPQPATGWNVYAGITGGILWLQNSEPIPVATTSYTFENAPSLNNGMNVGMGQHPDYNFAFQNVLWRA